MKLVSLQIEGLGDSGWSSEKLRFADQLTQIYAENGAGKTPLIKAIVFALGYKAEFPDDILANCDNVSLEVIAADRAFKICRSFQTKFWISVADDAGNRFDFENEGSFSRFMFELWGLEDPIVTTTNNAPSRIYVSQMLPLLYLDQSHGYSVDYYVPQRFIKNQLSEVLRLLNGIAPRNPFDKRRARIEYQVRLEYLDRTVVRLEDTIAELASDVEGVRRPPEEIERDLHSAINDLALLQESGGATDQVVSGMDARIAELHRQQGGLKNERSELEARVRGFSQIQREIEAESDTLVLNEEARRILASFDEICANERCGLFIRSSVSYGKSLLYLKDQVKDLQRSSEKCGERILKLSESIKIIDVRIEVLREERENAQRARAVSELVDMVEQLTGRIISLRRGMRVENELRELETRYVGVLDEREKVQKQVSGLAGGSAVVDVELLRLRTSMADVIAFWLGVLRTPNVSPEVAVDSDFNVTFGGQKVSKFSGSTLTRVVLAVRTAAIQVGAARGGLAPRFYILDTPRQQDIAREDLANFIVELRKMSAREGVQVVYSTTNHRYAIHDEDTEWLPAFPGDLHKMFLGQLSQIKI